MRNYRCVCAYIITRVSLHAYHSIYKTLHVRVSVLNGHIRIYGPSRSNSRSSEPTGLRTGVPRGAGPPLSRWSRGRRRAPLREGPRRGHRAAAGVERGSGSRRPAPGLAGHGGTEPCDRLSSEGTFNGHRVQLPWGGRGRELFGFGVLREHFLEGFLFFSFSLLSFFLPLVFLLLPQFRGHSDLSSPNLSAAFLN